MNTYIPADSECIERQFTAPISVAANAGDTAEVGRLVISAMEANRQVRIFLEDESGLEEIVHLSAQVFADLPRPSGFPIYPVESAWINPALERAWRKSSRHQAGAGA